MPKAAATATEQHAVAKESPISERPPEHSKPIASASEVLANYEDKNGWVHSEEYFKELVQESNDIEENPSVSSEGKDLSSIDAGGKPSQHRLTPHQCFTSTTRPLSPKDIMTDRGFALSLMISSKMIMRHLKSELKREIAAILETHTTSREQLSRIQSLLKDIGKFTRILRLFLFATFCFFSV